MSTEIGAVLEKILFEQKISKTKFAAECGISKSFLLRIIKNEKKMSENILHQILGSGILNSNNSTLLRNTYYSSFYGKDNFENIMYLIELFNTFEVQSEPLFIRNSHIEGLLNNGKQIHVINSQTELLEIIAYSSKNELLLDNPLVYTNYSVDTQILDQLLYCIFKDRDYNKEIGFCHLENISNNKKHELLLNVHAMKFGQIALNTYIENKSSSSSSSELFSKYIILSDKVILFNNDISMGILLNNSDTANFYKSNFEKILKDYSPLVKFFDNEIDFLFHTKENILFKETNFNFMDGRPCLEQFLTEDILKNCAHNNLENKEYLINLVLLHYTGVAEKFRGNEPHQYYNKEVFEDFSKSGKLTYITSKFIHPLSNKDREIVLNNVIEFIDNYPNNLVTFNNLVKIPKGISIEFSKTNSFMTGTLENLIDEVNVNLPIFFQIHGTTTFTNSVFYLSDYITKNSFYNSDMYFKEFLKSLILKLQMIGNNTIN